MYYFEIYLIKLFYLSESKILQYYRNMKYNSATPDTSAEHVKVMNNILYCEIPSSPDTLRLLLVGFASVARSTASESTVLALSARLSNFFQPKQNFFNCLVIVLWLCGTLYIIDSPSTINSRQQERLTKLTKSAWHNHVWYHLRSGRIVTTPLDSQLPIN